MKDHLKKILKSPHPDNIAVCVFNFLAKKIKVFAVIFCMQYWKACWGLLETSS